MPAFAKTMSMPPWPETASSNAARTEASSVTSTCAVRTSPPRDECAGDLLEPLPVDVGERHPRAALGEHLGDREAEPLAAPVTIARPPRTSKSRPAPRSIGAHRRAPAPSSPRRGCRSRTRSPPELPRARTHARSSGSTASRWRATSSAASAKSSRLQQLTPSTSSSRNGSAPMRSGTSWSRARRRPRGPPARRPRARRASAPARRSPRSRPPAARLPPLPRAARRSSSGSSGPGRRRPLPRSSLLATRSASSTLAPRSSAAIATAWPIGPAPSTSTRSPAATRPRLTVRTAIDIGSMNAVRRASMS